MSSTTPFRSRLASTFASACILLCAPLLVHCGSDSSDEPADDGSNNPPGDNTSAHFVLVHGAWMGQWCWSDVVAGLTARGAKVQTVDLPGHGDDMTPPSELSLEAYVKAVNAAIDAVGAPVILVGHSMGGMPITQTAEQYPDKISKLVYLGALFPKDGDNSQALLVGDTDSLIPPVLTPNPMAGTASIPQDKLKEIFCADCTDAETTNFLSHYRDEPLPSLNLIVHTTNEGWGSVKKYYIHTQQDRAVSFKVQQQMVSGVKLEKAITLNTSHSPFLSAPSEVVDTLLDL